MQAIIAVALRKESVDRNMVVLTQYIQIIVALRKESVDRNFSSLERYSSPPEVALRKESVDRNSVSPTQPASGSPSLSARRAWIEIEL